MSTPAVPTDTAFHAFATAGLWPGLPRATAEALPTAGIGTRDDVTPARLSRLPRVDDQKASRLVSAFVAAAGVLELVDLLLGLGQPVRLAVRAVDTLGRDALRRLREDPWALLAVPGVDADLADRVARAVDPGVGRDDPRRGRALVGHVLAEQAREGHTVTPLAAVAEALAPFGVPDALTAVHAALDGGAVAEAPAGEDTGLSPAPLAEAEAAVALDLARLVATAEPLRHDPAAPALARLDPTQRGAVRAVMDHGLSLLTGGPGTGKSATVAAVVEQCERAGVPVALAAPTGRAAKRLEELTGAPAATVHRLLGASPRARDTDDESGVGVGAGGGPGGPGGPSGPSGSGGPRGGAGASGAGGGGGRGWSSVAFSRGEDWPLDEAVVVVDEASMLDTELAAALVAACADGTHLLVVGDPAQLPSVGPGQVLADLLAAVAGRDDVPTTELTTLYRQAEGGAIARLATAVRGGELPPVPPSPDREVVVVPARGSAEAAHRVVQLVTDSIPRALGIAADAVQVVTPVHGGAAGTVELNAALKAVLNPPRGRGRGGRPDRFDVGDRVVATANHLEAEPTGYANGEVGVVTATGTRGSVTVEFGSGPAVVAGRALADLVHGWAVTVHRAQGSEFPAVVVVLPPEAGRMLSRPLVYTAITRAQRHLSVVHAAGPAVARAVGRIGTLSRRTGLAARLREELAEL